MRMMYKPSLGSFKALYIRRVIVDSDTKASRTFQVCNQHADPVLDILILLVQDVVPRPILIMFRISSHMNVVSSLFQRR
jgi:hypothetical protein